jgi:hypothetical protein
MIRMDTKALMLASLFGELAVVEALLHDRANRNEMNKVTKRRQMM